MFEWRKEITPAQWKTLFAAHLGWMLDGFDVMLYAFALLSIKNEFGLSGAEAGLVASATLLSSALGGVAAGVLADRFGRAKILIFSILTYSLFTGLTATSGALWQLLVWRLFVGLGLGAEWSAGSVLVAESWPAEHRGKASGLVQSGWAIGYILAALASMTVLTHWGWRFLFLLGVLPALVTLWIRRNVPESPVWIGSAKEMTRSFPWRKILTGRVFAATLLTTFLLFAYWGLFTWIPGYLSSPVEKGGAGLDIVKSAAFIIPMQAGAFFGYTSFGFFADRFGRRPVFVVFVLAAAVFVPVYASSANRLWLLMAAGPLVGFFGHGYFSLFGAWLAELFDSDIRATAQGLCYNAGRAVSAFAPAVIGAAADRFGIGSALALTSGFYIVGAFLIFSFPETKGERLR